MRKINKTLYHLKNCQIKYAIDNWIDVSAEGNNVFCYSMDFYNFFSKFPLVLKYKKIYENL